MVELMLNPKNRTANAIALENIAFSPLPSAPSICVIIIDDINPNAEFIICALNVNDILFLRDNDYLIDSLFLISHIN
jgi:hypothetical protein